jgi:hypothetical protein
MIIIEDEGMIKEECLIDVSTEITSFDGEAMSMVIVRNPSTGTSGCVILNEASLFVLTSLSFSLPDSLSGGRTTLIKSCSCEGEMSIDLCSFSHGVGGGFCYCLIVLESGKMSYSGCPVDSMNFSKSPFVFSSSLSNSKNNVS